MVKFVWQLPCIEKLDSKGKIPTGAPQARGTRGEYPAPLNHLGHRLRVNWGHGRNREQIHMLPLWMGAGRYYSLEDASL